MIPSRFGAGLEGVLRAVPVDPDATTARDWLRRVLAAPEYQRARPSLLDLIREWVLQLLEALRLPAVPGGPPLIVVAIPLLLLIGALVAAFLRYGLPRLRRRVGETDGLFDATDARTAATLRRDAERAARAGDWALAIAEQFRALSRALADRTVVSVAPGSTAHSVARSAGAVFPAFADPLEAAASAFDRVRYLGGAGSEADYDELVRLDRALAAARPAADPAADAALVGSVPPR